MKTNEPFAVGDFVTFDEEYLNRDVVCTARIERIGKRGHDGEPYATLIGTGFWSPTGRGPRGSFDIQALSDLKHYTPADYLDDEKLLT